MDRESLDRLAQQHAAEEAAEAARRLVDDPRPMRLHRPAGGHLPTSTAWLERLYADGRVVREKKPPVIDHLRSHGPWLVSVDPEPLSVLDAMSQTATLPAGFSHDSVTAAYFAGEFADTLVRAGDTTIEDHPAADDFRSVIRAHLSPALTHVSFTNSGAEANEKALALCRRMPRGQTAHKVLAFEGSFHGRTLLALHATWNPAKRTPFEIAGYEALYAPFPVWLDPMADEPVDPEGWRELLSVGRLDELVDRLGAADPLLTEELASLRAVDEALRSGQAFACIVEPMQSEGGDRYATGRFFRGLRLLTRHHHVPLVFDEVQTGFGLSGPFFWHTRFGLVNAAGAPDYPDAVTIGKRAQVGVCASHIHDPEPTATHPASLVRGRIHAEDIGDGSDALWIEARVRPRLLEMARRFPELVQHPRATGYAVAFDLPTPQQLDHYIAQRFWRGAVVFAAGSRTVRYRLNQSFDEREIDLLFEAIEQSLSWLRARPGEAPPAWVDVGGPGGDGSPRVQTRIRQVLAEEADTVLPALIDLEARIYEPARRDPEQRLRQAIEHPDGIALLAEVLQDDRWVLAGYAFAVPLERVAEVEGPDRDPLRGHRQVLYSIAVSVDPAFRGLGLGEGLKAAQLREAEGRRRPDDRPRFRYIVGRNRVGHADVMTRLNQRYGAYALEILENQYGEEDAEALYYRLPVGPLAPDPYPAAAPEYAVDLADGVAAPFGPGGPESLRQAEQAGLLYGPAVNKLTLCNYATPAVVRAMEWVGALAPELPHLFLTSSRDETFDKTLRLLRWHRKEGRVVIGFEGTYVGHTTAAARSLSDPVVQRQGAAYFDWPRVPHPEADLDACLAALAAAVEQAGGPARVLAVVVETVQERMGPAMTAATWRSLDAFRRDTGIPVVAVETASAGYRSGLGPFACLAQGFAPDILTWWAGGQVGFVHVGEALHVPTPLAMISTWDGDELSLVRIHHNLRAARLLDVGPAVAVFDAVAARFEARGHRVRGLGLYRVATGGGVEDLGETLEESGILCRELPHDAIALAPRLDTAEQDLTHLLRALDELS